MHEECHRCGADLDVGGGSFCCSQCGAPQLHLVQAMTEEADEVSTTGAAPPPRLILIQWNAALRSALLVAVVGAGLFTAASFLPALTIVSLLWICAAASVAISLYRRSEPTLRMNGSIGARIGLSVGVLMTALLSISLAVVGLIARFGLHSMGAFDAEMSGRMREQVEKAIAANPAPAHVVQQMLSQEFRTGVMLAGLLIFAAMILALSTIGGLVSGMMAVSRNRSA